MISYDCTLKPDSTAGQHQLLGLLTRVHLSIVIMAGSEQQDATRKEFLVVSHWSTNTPFKVWGHLHLTTITDIQIIANFTIIISMRVRWVSARWPTWKELECRDASQLSLHPLQPHLRGHAPPKSATFDMKFGTQCNLVYI